MRRHPSSPPSRPAPAEPSACRCGERSRAHWYRTVLGWPVRGGGGEGPVLLETGALFDVLEVPAPAGLAVVERLRLGSPVVLDGRTTRFLVAAGSAEELPGLLQWLEWGGLATGLRAYGAGACVEAPHLPSCGRTETGSALGTASAAGREEEAGRGTAGAAREGRAGREPTGAGGGGPARSGPGARCDWLVAPHAGAAGESGAGRPESFPGLDGLGGGGGAPGLARLVDAAATECHRIGLWGPAARSAQRCASSYA
ncbi:SCO3374 family protein [Streptomyces sp. NPDC049954]|uniref:SCO3374 family protein n=1 Tax=Streptomyces sp. NPDC049954 TaxID=3155779 RepID=UPI0034490346